MELLINFKRLRGAMLPVNYQYALSSWIYKVIGQADSQHSAFLHEKGFSFDGKQFKMFTFSQLDVRPFRIEGNRIRLLGDSVSLTVRFLVDASLHHFIKGLFMHQHCGLGIDRDTQVDFEVTTVQVKEPPVFMERMQYTCLSPIVTSTRRDDGTVQYLSPEDPGFGTNLIQNLKRKQSALAAHDSDEPQSTASVDTFRLLNTPRKKGITIKEGTPQESKVIAYLFNFELTVSPDLHEVGYYAGFGEKNSMGMGCVGVR